MFLPKLKIIQIHPEDNVQFIINYLSADKQKNNTRPFFEKTISLYPELKDVGLTEDESLRNEIIKLAVLKRLADHKLEIQQRIEYFQEKFDSFIYNFIEAQCKLFNYEWKESQPEIICYVGYLPFYPRSAKDKCFYVSFQDEERVFSGAVHEINHMIFYEKWNEMHGGSCEEKLWPDPLWYMEEIVVDPTLNDESVKKFTLYENKAYSQFYVLEKGSNESIMDRVKVCYENRLNIEAFLEEAYSVICEYVEELK